MTFMWMVMKTNLIRIQMLAGNCQHYSSSTDRTHTWRILICGHVCTHVHASWSYSYFSDTTLSTGLSCNQRWMVGKANSLGEPKNNLLSYCVKDFIMYTFVMYMIKRNFLNPVFFFLCLLSLEPTNLCDHWNSRCRTYLLGFSPIYVWSYNY